MSAPKLADSCSSRVGLASNRVGSAPNAAVVRRGTSWRARVGRRHWRPRRCSTHRKRNSSSVRLMAKRHHSTVHSSGYCTGRCASPSARSLAHSWSAPHAALPPCACLPRASVPAQFGPTRAEFGLGRPNLVVSRFARIRSLAILRRNPRLRTESTGFGDRPISHPYSAETAPNFAWSPPTSGIIRPNLTRSWPTPSRSRPTWGEASRCRPGVR